ncbi:MAG TPA: tetratricopeptide repeat protein [Planctomycetota bacterium]|nr:tetratricopeptide repeat protein [Planctomycetota bacterium]
MRNKLGVMAVLVLSASVIGGEAAPAAAAKTDATARETDFAARRMLEKARELFQSSENERAVKMVETLLDQYPKSPVRYQAYMVLGRHYIDTRQQSKAIALLRNMKDFEKRESELSPEDRDLYIESLYLTGIAYFQMRQYGQATPMLRKITTNYPNTIWANQAFFYIGMCHFTQGRWSQAIDALGLVGTFVDPDSPTTEFVEAGYRFFVKVEDADLPVLSRLGKETNVKITTQLGDSEILPLAALSASSETFIGSIATEIGPAKPNDKTLQVRGGDSISVSYVDDNTKEGKKGEPRDSKVLVVSTAALNFTLGTYESKAAAAFIDQPLFVQLTDVDRDSSPKAEAVQVRVVSRYKIEEEQSSAERSATDIDKLFSEKEESWKIRDEVTQTLNELGAEPVHSGRFGGNVKIVQFSEAQTVDKSDATLTCAIDDDVVAYYVDDLHIGGKTPRQVEAHIRVIGEIDSRARAPLYEVFDPTIKAQKALVEARAHLELARIFKSMGLMKGVEEKCKVGLEHADSVIQSRTPLPSHLREEAFQLKWEMFIAQENFQSAIATCQLFNQLFPNSPFVDQALLGIGNVKFEDKKYGEAIGVFRQVLNLKNSTAKAEAQFKIAECMKKGAQKGARDQAINEYKLCAERYPDSPFAGAALGEMVDYYVDTQDYRLANDLLERVFQDYPDAQFLDSMLLKWVVVAFKTGEVQKAYDKCSQLLFDYPSSPHADKAKELLPRLEQRLKSQAPKEGAANEK